MENGKRKEKKREISKEKKNKGEERMKPKACGKRIIRSGKEENEMKRAVNIYGKGKVESGNKTGEEKELNKKNCFILLLKRLLSDRLMLELVISIGPTVVAYLMMSTPICWQLYMM